LREQTKRTFQAGRALFDAHLELARTEFQPILANVKIALAEFGIAIAMALFIAVLAPVGTVLFLGEWWFGSMGWGILHGVLFSAAIAATAIVLFLDPDPGPVVRAVVLGVLAGIVAGVFAVVNLSDAFWIAVTDAMNLDLADDWRLPITAAAVSAIAGAILGALVGAWRGGASSVVGGLVTGTLLLAVVGVLTALVTFSFGPGVGFGIAVGLAAWIGFMLYDLGRRGVDEDSFRARFYPEQTIETAKETMAHFGFRPDEAVETAQQAADVAQAATEVAGAAVADAAGMALDAAKAARAGVERTVGGTESGDKEPS
jgi:hypothetical protein